MNSARGRRRRWFWAALVVVAVVVAGGYLYYRATAGRPYEPPPMAFRGPSDELRQTVVVPTLDTPIEDGKTVVWCGSFQLAWNRLRDDIARGPVRLDGARAVVDRLNRGEFSEEDLAPGSGFAVAGRVEGGVVGDIQAEMSRRFPNAPRPDLDGSGPTGVVAYAYLETSAKFGLPFFDYDEPTPFTDPAGLTTPIGSFGIRKKDEYAYERLREQVKILDADREKVVRVPERAEFVVDLCKTSQPYQIILARVPRKATLAATVEDVERRIAASAGLGEDEGFRTRLNAIDTLLVPNIAFEITHRFREVEGAEKRFGNPGLEGLHVALAEQTIRFRLDRSGAELSSEFKEYVKPVSSHYHFDRPFLVYLKKRGGGRPVFVMWVENAELLDRR